MFRPIFSPLFFFSHFLPRTCRMPSLFSFLRPGVKGTGSVWGECEGGVWGGSVRGCMGGSVSGLMGGVWRGRRGGYWRQKGVIIYPSGNSSHDLGSIKSEGGEKGEEKKRRRRRGRVEEEGEEEKRERRRGRARREKEKRRRKRCEGKWFRDEWNKVWKKSEWEKIIVMSTIFFIYMLLENTIIYDELQLT